VPGTFTYDVPPGTILTAGEHTFHVTFTPDDTTRYDPVALELGIRVYPPVSVLVETPNGGEVLTIGATADIRWTGENATGFDVYVSRDDGTTYGPIDGCIALPADAGSCAWIVSGPATASARARVVAYVTDGGVAVKGIPLAVDESDGAFEIRDQVIVAPTIKVTKPNRGSSWKIGSTQLIHWTHTLPADATVRIELSRDGGGSWATIADGVRNKTEDSGKFDWIVTGGATDTALVRVSSAGASVSSVSVAFRIRPAGL